MRASRFRRRLKIARRAGLVEPPLVVLGPFVLTSDHDLKNRTALASVATSAALTVAKLAAGVFSGSLALLSEAAHNAVDTGATVVTWLAIRESGKPADEDHHFGHEKFEALAALFETSVLLVLALAVVAEAIRRIATGHVQIDASVWVFAVLGISIAVDIVRWRTLSRVATATSSIGLAADAMHFMSDLVASCFVVAGLVATLAGWTWADAAASIAVAIFIAVAGINLARRTVATLLDTAPAGLGPRLKRAAEHVPGVTDVEDVRLRRLGGRVVGDMLIGVSRTLPIADVDRIKADVRAALESAEPAADIALTANPRTLDDETLLERVLLVAARRRLPVHHVTIQTLKGRIAVSFDLEVDGRMTQGEAHEIASALERSIRDEIGGEVEVESHIEPLETRELEGRDAPPALVAEIARRLEDSAAAAGTVFGVHKVRVRETAAGLVVNYHCRVDPTLSVCDVHDHVDALDHRVRSADSRIARLVGHAEPPRK
jgi:cation diffusion facilitator family transporter